MRQKELLMRIIRAVVGVIAAFQIVFWSSITPFYPRVAEFNAQWLINYLLIAAGFVAFTFAIRPTLSDRWGARRPGAIWRAR
jgi:hypothetical protein